MRNAIRFLSLLLVCILTFGLSVPAAKADTCYEVIKLIYEDTEDDSFVDLGEGVTFEPDSSNYVNFLASIPGNHVAVTGTSDLTGKYEGYVWFDVETDDVFLAFLEFCISYETLSELLTDNEALHGGIFLTEDGDPIIVSNATEAAAFIDTVKDYFGD